MKTTKSKIRVSVYMSLLIKKNVLIDPDSGFNIGTKLHVMYMYTTSARNDKFQNS